MVNNLLQTIHAMRVDKWILSADLGQTGDPTAITVVRHQVRPLETFTLIRERNLFRQDSEETIDCAHLERLPLNLSYVDQVAHVRMLLQRPPFGSDLKPDFLIDSTGVGRAVADLFDSCQRKPIRISITSGLEVNQSGAYDFSVPKQELISALDASMHSGKLRIAAKLREAEALRGEFVDFERKITASGRATYSARATAHDDLVLSLAMAVWWCKHRQRNVLTQEALRNMSTVHDAQELPAKLASDLSLLLQFRSRGEAKLSLNQIRQGVPQQVHHAWRANSATWAALRNAPSGNPSRDAPDVRATAGEQGAGSHRSPWPSSDPAYNLMASATTPGDGHDRVQRRSFSR